MAQWVNDLACLCGTMSSTFGPAQEAKDPAMLQLWCRLQLQLDLIPWPGNFHKLQVQTKKKKKKRSRETKGTHKKNIKKKKSTHTG